MRKTLLVPIVGLSTFALVLAACTGGPETSPSQSAVSATSTAGAPTEPTVSAPETFTVNVDGDAPTFNAGFLSYFPKELSVHPGDTVDFKLVDSGEPHTVTLGTLADAGLAAAAAATDPFAPVPELDKLPSLLPEGPGDANQTAATPCFVDSGEPPENERCPEAEPPPFTGTQTFYNSGWLGAEDIFSVALSPDIEPGTYGFFCLLHGQAMSGEINVVEAETAVKSPEEAAQEGQAQLDEIVAKLQPAVDQAIAATADTALAGTGSPEAQEGLATIFGPEDLSIPVGGSVTWTVLGPHTVSFNAPEDAVGIRVEAPDGSVHINEKSVVPANSPGQPPPPEPDPNASPPPPPDPNAPPPPPTVIDAGAWDGTGFRSSGIILSFPPELFAYKQTFTTAGTYTYQCLIHPDMEGTVTVGS